MTILQTNFHFKVETISFQNDGRSCVLFTTGLQTKLLTSSRFEQQKETKKKAFQRFHIENLGLFYKVDLYRSLSPHKLLSFKIIISLICKLMKSLRTQLNYFCDFRARIVCVIHRLVIVARTAHVCCNKQTSASLMTFKSYFICLKLLKRLFYFLVCYLAETPASSNLRNHRRLV